MPSIKCGVQFEELRSLINSVRPVRLRPPLPNIPNLIQRWIGETDTVSRTIQAMSEDTYNLIAFWIVMAKDKR